MGAIEAEVGVTFVETVRLVGAIMAGRGESTVEGISMVERRAVGGEEERGRGCH